MSEFADLTVARYLEQDREAARAYHIDLVVTLSRASR
jgi:hypothetical protein